MKKRRRRRLDVVSFAGSWIKYNIMYHTDETAVCMWLQDEVQCPAKPVYTSAIPTLHDCCIAMIGQKATVGLSKSVHHNSVTVYSPYEVDSHSFLFAHHNLPADTLCKWSLLLLFHLTMR